MIRAFTCSMGTSYRNFGKMYWYYYVVLNKRINCTKSVQCPIASFLEKDDNFWQLKHKAIHSIIILDGAPNLKHAVLDNQEKTKQIPNFARFTFVWSLITQITE